MENGPYRYIGCMGIGIFNGATEFCIRSQNYEIFIEIYITLQQRKCTPP